jgi:trimethylamine--corrinoid protein Co-methyltransferase
MREQSQVRIFDRRSRESWESLKTPDLVERAYENARKILATHEPPHVSEETRREIKEIIAEHLAEQD